MMKNIVGMSVEGDNFFGREAEVQELRGLTEDHHVLLLAPRRVGKTSLLRALRDTPQYGSLVTRVYVDVEAAKTEAQFVADVLQAVYATPAGKRHRLARFSLWRARRRKTRVKSVQVAGQGVELEAVDQSWMVEADHAFAKLLGDERTWLIMIDELPTLVLALAEADPSGARVRAFLQWLRSLRQQPRAVNKLRFILAGSIGLDNLARRFQISDTINDLRDWRLGPYSAATADRFLVELDAVYGLALTPELRAAILGQVEGRVPIVV